MLDLLKGALVVGLVSSSSVLNILNSPSSLQKKPPSPSSPDIILTCTPTFTAYVAESGGYKMDEFTLGAMATALSDVSLMDDVNYELV